MTDIYAEFGVNNAVLSTPVEEHEQAMLSQPVLVRDGDDIITSVENNNGTNANLSTIELEDSQNTETEEGSEAGQEGEQGEQSEETSDAPFESVGDVPEDLTNNAQQMKDSESAFNDMVADAAARGLSADEFSAIADAYAETGKISAASYEKLSAVGYSKAFIDSYIKGQEAMAEQYTQSVYKYAGGQDKFEAVCKHLAAVNPESAETLQRAIEGQDLGTIKAIINLAAGSFSKTFGKPSARTMTTQAKPAVQNQTQQVEGFSSQGEMVKAMSDRRYQTDDNYRRQVEDKVMASKF